MMNVPIVCKCPLPSNLGKRKFNIKAWKTFSEVFMCLPIAAVIDQEFFCVHSGISPDLHIMKQISDIQRPTNMPDSGIVINTTVSQYRVTL
jgi:diadenosine tetraphosphatase ApaH/serine/threonine PP2A family protein phosphatase